MTKVYKLYLTVYGDMFQVCNHVASMDDPLVMAALLPPRLLLHPKSLRWTLCATDRCFTNAAFSAFFRSVKVLPLKRGAGLQQEVICNSCPIPMYAVRFVSPHCGLNIE